MYTKLDYILLLQKNIQNICVHFNLTFILIGVNRNFQLAFIHDKLNNISHKKITAAQIWKHLGAMYDLNALVSMEHLGAMYDLNALVSMETPWCHV